MTDKPDKAKQDAKDLLPEDASALVALRARLAREAEVLEWQPPEDALEWGEDGDATFDPGKGAAAGDGPAVEIAWGREEATEEEDIKALKRALERFAFDESKHKRAPKGSETGGQFVSKGGHGVSDGTPSVSQVHGPAHVRLGRRILLRNWEQVDDPEDTLDGRHDDGYFYVAVSERAREKVLREGLSWGHTGKGTFGELGADSFGSVFVTDAGHAMGWLQTKARASGKPERYYTLLRIPKPAAYDQLPAGSLVVDELGTKDMAILTGISGPKSYKIRSVAKRAVATASGMGGATISVYGDVPREGYAYSPYKGAEEVFEYEDRHGDPKKNEWWRDEDGAVVALNDFIGRNAKLLKQKGHYIGVWEHEGRLYMDVSVVGEASEETIQKAREAKQLAVYDLKNARTIETGWQESEDGDKRKRKRIAAQAQGTVSARHDAGGDRGPHAEAGAGAERARGRALPLGWVRRGGDRVAFKGPWNEDDHPRGHPTNAGRFRKKSDAEKKKAAKKPDDKPIRGEQVVAEYGLDIRDPQADPAHEWEWPASGTEKAGVADDSKRLVKVTDRRHYEAGPSHKEWYGQARNVSIETVAEHIRPLEFEVCAIYDAQGRALGTFTDHSSSYVNFGDSWYGSAKGGLMLHNHPSYTWSAWSAGFSSADIGAASYIGAATSVVVGLLNGAPARYVYEGLFEGYALQRWPAPGGGASNFRERFDRRVMQLEGYINHRSLRYAFCIAAGMTHEDAQVESQLVRREGTHGVLSKHMTSAMLTHMAHTWVMNDVRAALRDGGGLRKLSPEMAEKFSKIRYHAKWEGMSGGTEGAVPLKSLDQGLGMVWDGLKSVLASERPGSATPEEWEHKRIAAHRILSLMYAAYGGRPGSVNYWRAKPLPARKIREGRAK